MEVFSLERSQYEPVEFAGLLKEAVEKNVSAKPFTKETRFMFWKETYDAKPGKVLWPVLKDEIDLVPKGEPGYEHFGYNSNFVGRNHFIHKEALFARKEWFVRIN